MKNATTPRPMSFLLTIKEELRYYRLQMQVPHDHPAIKLLTGNDLPNGWTVDRHFDSGKGRVLIFYDYASSSLTEAADRLEAIRESLKGIEEPDLSR